MPVPEALVRAQSLNLAFERSQQSATAPHPDCAEPESVRFHEARAHESTMKPAELATTCLSFDPPTAHRALGEWATGDEAKRRSLLTFADRAGLTLHLRRVAQDAGVELPPADRAACEERLRKNRLRLQKHREGTAALLALFRSAVLRSFTLEPEFVPAAHDRVQYDLDFYLSPDHARMAFALLQARGYEPLISRDGGPLDHLPALARKTGWEWRGDFFDLDIPLRIDLHFQLWDSGFECIPVQFHPEPLTRLTERHGIPMLDGCDQLASCALHTLRHLFRGSLRVSHLYEIAYFLDTHASASEFWRQWREALNPSLRRLCAATFALASRVFQCRLAPELEPEMALLPPRASAWVTQFSSTVVEQQRSRKAEVLLQLSFIAGWRRRLRVLRRRLLPLSLPDPVDAVYLPAERLSAARRLLRTTRQARFVLSRVFFHLRALPGFLRAVGAWWLR